MHSDGASELVPSLRGISHAAAFLLAVAAAVVLIVLAPGGRAVVAVTIYGGGLIALFGGSALYHRWPGPRRFKPLLRRIDHSTIFVFIAASYTPVALIVMEGPIAWVLLIGAVGGRARGRRVLAGLDRRAATGFVAGSYVVLGWMALIAAPQLVRALDDITPCCSSWRAACCTRSARSSTRASGRTRGRARSAFTRSSTRSSSSPPPRTTSR